jgi:hypothetical protein
MNINVAGKDRYFINNSEIINKLPNRNHILCFDSIKGFYLEEIEDFRIPKKIYGNHENFVSKILNRFYGFSKTLGVHLTGEKGSGKTLLSQLIASKSDCPTIIINACYTGTAFISFINQITQPCVLLFDEFDKYYCQTEKQNDLLQILDSNYATPKLIILTSNTTNTNSHYLKNRVSRIFYYKDFVKMEDSLIKEILLDLLENKELLQECVDVIQENEIFNIDSIMGFISEINFTKLSPKQAVSDMCLFADNNTDYVLSFVTQDGGLITARKSRIIHILNEIKFQPTKELKILLKEWYDEDDDTIFMNVSDFNRIKINGGEMFIHKTNSYIKFIYKKETRILNIFG